MGGGEIFLILLAVLVLFGADKMPGIARGIGRGMREFQKAADEIKSELVNSTSDIRSEMNNIRSDVQDNISQARQTMDEPKSEIRQSTDSKSETNTGKPDESYSIYQEANLHSNPDMKESRPTGDSPKSTFIDEGANI